MGVYEPEGRSERWKVTWTPEEWDGNMSPKSAGDDFKIKPGTMGRWIDSNRAYLEGAVGPPDLH